MEKAKAFPRRELFAGKRECSIGKLGGKGKRGVSHVEKGFKAFKGSPECRCLTWEEHAS